MASTQEAKEAAERERDAAIERSDEASAFDWSVEIGMLDAALDWDARKNERSMNKRSMIKRSMNRRAMNKRSMNRRS